MIKDSKFLKARDLTESNLNELKLSLVRCIEDGMIDSEDHYYNEVLDLLSDVEILSSWDELTEAIIIAKALEVDVNAWLARKGRTSFSLSWPIRE